jgi:hypothetical protein
VGEVGAEEGRNDVLGPDAPMDASVTIGGKSLPASLRENERSAALKTWRAFVGENVVSLALLTIVVKTVVVVKMT